MTREMRPSRRGWIAAAKRVGLAAFALTAGMGAAGDPPDPRMEARRKVLPLYGGGATLVTARTLGVKEIMGKVLPTGPKTGSGGVSKFDVESASESIAAEGQSNNVAIRDFPNVSENEPTVAANPRNPKKVVAGMHFIGDTANRCVAHFSSDGGKTWSVRPIFMPQLTHQSQCSDPVLAYAPDGSRVYYAYMDIKFTNFDIVVSWSDDDGKSWKGPVKALSNPAADFDKPWIGTHVPVGGSQSNRNWVYVSATRFTFTGGGCFIDFARSSNKGATWSAPQSLDSGVCAAPSSSALRIVQGSRPNGGLGGGVLVAWYHSGTDGWLEGSFNIRTRYSSNNGATFGPVTVAATDNFELPFFLGPEFAYHRWWGGMFPDVEIAPSGSGHIVYTHDPVPDSATAEDGDIRYVGAAGPPYGAWSAPTTVNDDASGKAQGWATLEATSQGSKATLHAIWEDHRTSPSDNLKYDVFSAERTGSATPGPWAVNEKLTTAFSTSDFFFLGDYFDITVAHEGDDDDDGRNPFVYGVWTDRRDEPTVLDLDDDIWGARLSPGSNNGD